MIQVGLKQMNRRKKCIITNINQKKVEVAKLTWDKIYLKAKKITRHKEGHYVMIK